MQNTLVEKYAHPTPRYTSYPTAPHFHGGIAAETYGAWLKALAPSALSLYIHIPYCDRLCWFCGCTTKQTNRYEPVNCYLAALEREIMTVGGLVSNGCTVTALHLGRGSPTLLEPKGLVRLDHILRDCFPFSSDA